MWESRMKRTRFIKRRKCGGCNIMRKRGGRRKSLRKRGWLEEEESRARLITSGSKFPVNHFYNTQAIRLKEEAIRLRPTFHLRLAFMSSTQFYHSEWNVCLSADAILPCYNLNRAGLIITSPRANMLPTKTYIYPRSTAQISQMFSLMPAITLAELVFCIINGFISTWTGGQSAHRAFMSAQPATKQSSLLPHSAKPHPSPVKREAGFITHFNKQHKTNSSARLFGGAADLTQACLN